MAESKKPGHFSGLMRKLSGRSKKEDKDLHSQSAASSSRGADTLSPYAALDSKTQPSVGSSSKGAENLPPRSTYAPAPKFSALSSDSEDPPPYDAPIVDPPVKKDDQFSLLAEFDTVFLIDDSGSMREDRPSRWDQVRDTVKQIAPKCTEHDSDGIDIYFLNRADEERFRNITSAETVIEIFEDYQPCGLTPTGTRLNAILETYVKNCEDMDKHGGYPKRLNVIVITDGFPTDTLSSPLATVLSNFGKRLDEIDAFLDQLGVMFCQIGNSKEAQKALEELDDKMCEDKECRDFVDYLKYEGTLNEDKLLKLVLGAVNRKYDAKTENLIDRNRK